MTARHFPGSIARRRRLANFVLFCVWCALVGSCAAVLWYAFETWSQKWA